MTRTARGRRGNDGATKRARANQRPTEKPSSSKGGPSNEERSTSPWRMFLRDRSVRARVVALVILPLLGTLVLGTMFFKNALDDASSASRVESLAEVGVSALSALDSVQNERDVTGLAESGGTGAGAVSEARAATDAAIADLTEQIEARSGDDFGGAFRNAVEEFERELSRLDGYRTQRDAANPPFDQAGISAYHRFADALQGLVAVSGSVNEDPALARNISSLADISHAVEAASMERGLVAFFITPGASPTPAQRDQANALQSEQHHMLEGRFISNFGITEQARIYANQILLGNREIAAARSDINNGVPARTTKEAWFESATNRLDSLREIQRETAEGVVRRAADTADSARLTAIITAVAILVVLALTIYLTVVVARSIIGPLRRLRASALEAAQTQLPALVDRVHKDGPIAARDIDDAVKAEGRDEIGQVATAFNDVHSTAVRVAAEQALLRQNLDTIVVNLSRRTQSLVDRQLGEIEGLEQRESDPDQLSALFRIDHMATRVRRHAESLLVLAGVDEMRKHSSAAGVLDVVRTAVGEVEQYPRVKFGVMPTDLVAAGAVDDIAHLLAELIDNATEFSAPATPVRVTSEPLLGGGLRLQVSDSGLGIPADQLEELNDRLRNVGDIDVAASRTLGLYVVARLAAKHGIQVRLELLPEGGTAAQVDLPAHLILSPLDTSEGVLSPITPETQVPPAPPAAPAPTSAPASSSPWSSVGDMTPAPVSSSGLPSRGSSGFGDGTDHGGSTWPLVRETPEEPAETASPLVDSGEFTRAELPSWQRPTTRIQTSPDAGSHERAARPPASATPSAHVAPPSVPEPAPARNSLRAPEPELPESDSPIFDSVASAWFSRPGTSTEDWSSPADEGWRRAAEALRSAEEAASARRSQRDTEPIPDARQRQASGWARAAHRSGGISPTTSVTAQSGAHAAPSTPSMPAAPSTPAAPSPAVQAPPAAAAEHEPALSSSGLPVRRRGASLVPGSIADTAESGRAQRPAARAKDASTVASTLSSLQRGVGRGREETGGWVPQRPSDPERSNP